MNVKEAFDFIDKAAQKGSVLGLERIRATLDLLGNPQDDLKFIHIGGTNGKGSVSAFLSNILKEAGLKVGLFISPYIEEYNERIQIDNINITDEEIADIIGKIKPVVDSVEDMPTEFELNTIIALMYFKERGCDMVILEVGLGGEFDSTNIIDKKELAILTAIGFDHMQELGNTIEKITTTKSKIIKDDTDVVVYRQSKDVTDIIKNRCDETGSRLYISEPDRFSIVAQGVDGMVLNVKGFGDIETRLAAGYQKDNIALVFKAVEVLNSKGYDISDENIKNGFKNTSWPGRFEKIYDDPVFIVDGSHNMPGMTATVESIKTIFDGKKVMIIMGVLQDKEYEQMVDVIMPLADSFITVAPDNPRALQADKLAEIIKAKGKTAVAFDELKEAIIYAMDAAREKGLPVCAIGSLYLVGDVKKIVRIQKNVTEEP